MKTWGQIGACVHHYYQYHYVDGTVHLFTELDILGAAYGRADVTRTLNASVTPSHGTLHVSASNSVFGDSWRHVRKTLVVVYQHADYDPHIVVVREHHVLNIAPRPARWCLDYLSGSPSGGHNLIIIGAVYGLADVTYQVRSMVRNNHLSVSARNHVFGDTYHRVRKTLVVVYRYGDGPCRTKIVTEGQTLRI